MRTMGTSTTTPLPPPPAPGRAASGEAGPARVLGRRPPLPGRRAVLGGVLVGLAVLGTYAAAGSNGSVTARPAVVATRPLGPGHRLGPDDLRIEPAAVPPALDDVLLGDPDDAAGAVLVGPVGPGEPLTRSIIVPGGPSGADGPSVHELSFGIERDHAVGGTLRPGDLVDVLATFGTGEAARTTVLVRRAVVSGHEQATKGAVGSTGSLTVTLALPDEETVVAVTHAVEVGTVTLVRSTASDPTRDRPAPDATTPPADGPAPTPAPTTAVRRSTTTRPDATDDEKTDPPAEGGQP